MDTLSVLVNVDDRSIVLELENNSFFTLQATFMDMCKADMSLKNRLADYMPVFQSLNQKFKKYIELPKNKPIIDAQEIFVKWVPFHLQAPPLEDVEKPGPSIVPVQPAVTKADGPGSSISSTSESDEEIDNSWLSKAKALFNPEDWKELSGFEKRVEAGRLEKHTLLQSMGTLREFELIVSGILEGDYVPTSKVAFVAPKRKSNNQRGKNKENVAPHSKRFKEGQNRLPAVPKRRSTRQNKSRVLSDNEDEDEDEIFFNSKESEKESNHEVNSVSKPVQNFHDDTNYEQFRKEFDVVEEEDTAHTSPKKKTKKTKAKQAPKGKKPISERRKPQIVPRKFSKQIRQTNAVPKFTEKLEGDIRLGRHSVQRLYLEIRDHIELHSGGLYLTPREWTLLCSSIVRMYPTLADCDNPLGHDTLKRGIQKSITSRRYHMKEKLESQNTQGGELQVVLAVDQVSDETASHLQALQSGTSDDHRVRWLIKKTLEVRHREMTESTIQTYMAKYPHYMNSKMLLYEYALTCKFDLLKLHQNADVILKKLNVLFQDLNFSDNIELILELQEQLYPAALRKRKEGAITKFITAMNVSEAEARIGVLDTTQEVHSPCVLLLIDTDDSGHRSIKSSYWLSR
ncbi:Polyamine-modulated factor 1-binding protein 1 [Frankliniella fusca]|uniref:Polyamine-modulated factor 1-binding protein 1 n=1 Tax=Frankliniella fusca TaxID=407009 RepID=A0AAE1LL58_9NEOP|nr:Polyamine-modulated factor 1-binding protein 1 [Frankliniella fusca]KAK3919269.1 Polyamine-modulated factor 1-binding protein 1 [Frankliniella fusca]KAK3924246.1 Polyamine-modulated factor 1-binding protein 1 [Frankliniella fusca]KAK3931475.1 Polyamine-modulated factor 1-binding protein 1 [Frankliniella fusca]